MKPAEHGGQILSVARRLGVPPEEILDFSASINPLGPAPAVKAAILAAMDRIVHYPDSAATELQETLAAEHQLAADHVAVGNGSTELIYLLPRLLPAPRWRRALIVAPPFAEYARALERDGWHVDYFILDAANGFALQLDRLQHRLQAGYDLLVLANPGNPTGRLYPLAECTQLAAIAEASEVLLVLDEAFMDFCPAASLIPLISRYQRLVILRSLTKFHAIPGLRLGYAVASPPLAARLRGLREPWSINVLAQAAGLAALGAQEHRAATLAYIANERARLAADLNQIPGLTLFPGAANYLLLRLPAGKDGRLLAAALEEQRILIRPCGSFPGLDSSFIRVAVRTTSENARLVAALVTELA
jgi:threonine-phosphate decarboxylase